MHTYFKLAVKVLARRKFFTFISLFGISMTLVVLMVATAMLDDVFAPHAPESRFDRVLTVYRVSESGPHNTLSSEPGFAFVQQYVKTLHDIERASAFTNAQDTAIYRSGSRIDTTVKRTDGDYWNILDFHFLEGGPFTSADDERGAPVAVISETMREKLFDGQPAVGRTFELEGRTFRVVGVVPRVPILRLAAYSEVWLPIGTLASSGYRHDLIGGFHGLVLAKSRADFPRLKREFQTSLRQFPLDRKLYSELHTGLDTTFEAVARLLTWNKAGDNAPMIVRAIVATLAILFMSLPALNLVTLNLSRILERAPEIGVRKAFGAPRTALVAQFLFENVVLTVIGGILGFALAIAVLAAITSSGVIPNAHLGVNLRVFAYGMALAVFFGVFSGVYPAWRMSRFDPVTALRGGAL